MLTLFLNFCVVCLLVAIVMVFVIQWAKKMITEFKSGNKISVLYSGLALFGAIVLANIAYGVFESYLPGTNKNIVFLLAFGILGIGQLVWENYKDFKEWFISLIKKKAEKEAGV